MPRKYVTVCTPCGAKRLPMPRVVKAKPSLRCAHCGNRDVWTEGVRKGWRSFRCNRCGKLTHVKETDLPSQYPRSR